MFVLVTMMTAALTLAAPPAANLAAVQQNGGVQQAQAEIKPIDLNAATAEELEKIPGIGEVLARRIVDFRNEHGAFERIDDLLNVRGIGVTSLEKLRPYLTIKKKA